MTDIDLTNTVALVTGGGRGLGRVTALRLAAAGARVAVAARSAEQLAETVALVGHAGGFAVPIVADVTDGDAVERMMADAEAALGPIDLLVNNAGKGAAAAPLWEMNADDWWATQEANVRGPFLCMRAALRRMVPRGRGRIVNVSSRVGNVGPPFTSAYTTSKAALTRLSEIAAAEARPYGVHVFVMEPGTVRTAMTERLIASEGARTWLPWYRAIFEEGRDVPPEVGATLIARLAAGHADALAGRFLSQADDLDALVADAERIARDDRLTLRLTPARDGGTR